MKLVFSFAPMLLAIILCVLFYGYGVAQEAPTGSIYGVATMKESGRPLAKVFVTLSPAKSSDGMGGRSVHTDSEGRYVIRNIAVGSYTISASARAHNMDNQSLDVKEGIRAEVQVVLKPREPYLNLDANQHVYAPDSAPQIQMSGFTRASNLQMTVTRLDPARLAKEGGLRQALEPLNANGRTVQPQNVGTLAIPASPVALKQDVEGVFHQRLTVPKLGEGLYWVELGTGSLHHGTFFNVTRLAMVTKFEEEKALAYCVDIVSGAPIQGVSILSSDGKGLKSVGITDKQGLAEVPSSTDDGRVILAQLGSSVAICDRGPGEGGDDSEDTGSDTVFVYTDRTIYRPGDTIQFKGLVRRLTGSDYNLPPTGPVTVSFKDPEGNTVLTSHLQSSARGSFHGSFVTSKESAPADYQIEAEFASSKGEVTVPVEVYRKPDYSITVRPDTPYCILGEVGHATIDCEYYFGGPVAGAKVNVSIYRSPIWSNGDSDDETDTEQPTEGGFQGGEYAEDYKLVTDANGQVKVTFPTRAAGDPDAFPADYTYTITADVSDEADHTFSGTGDVKVLRGDVDLSLSSNELVLAPGDTAIVKARVRSSNDGKPVSGADVELTVGHDTWDNETTKFNKLKVVHATTSSNGIAEFNLPVSKEGSLTLRGLVKDSKGRPVRSGSFIYVSGNDDFGSQRTQQISATLDKKHYGIGEKAKLLVQTDSPGGSALVTVEVDSVLSKQVVLLDQRSTILTLPLTREMAPNAFIGISYIRNSDYMEASKQIVVDRHDRDLQVTVTADRPTAQPGETVTYAIDTRDAAGKPVSANTSLAVVDESLFAVRHDLTNIQAEFYPHRQNGVVTSYSFPEIYLDGGDKGNGKLPIRSKFKDTAAWEPEVQTDANGHASVRVTLPDNLTQWRATAVACGDLAEVGMGKTTITARKDLMVRIQTPTYLVSGDNQDVALIVTNDSGQDADVRLNVNLVGLKTSTQIPSTLHVANGKPEAIQIHVEATESGDATMTASARLPNGTGDAVRMALPIRAHGREEFESKAGDTDNSVALEFTRLPDADPHAGGLEISLTPSIGAGMLRSASSLIDFPYGCVEQTMSKFLPSILVVQALKKAGLPLPKSAAKLPEIASDSFTRLARMQHKDGGWGWWEHDGSNPFMTALVLDGLKRAADAGYPTPTSIDLEAAAHFGAAHLKNHKPTRDTSLEDLYLAFSVAERGRKEVARVELNLLSKVELSDSGLALAALTASNCGVDFQPYLVELRKRMKGVAGSSHWVASKFDSLWGNEPTALALVAFTTLAPTDPVIPSGVRYLMSKRAGACWSSTRETAYAVIGLTRYLSGIKEDLAPFEATVAVNGKPVKTLRLDPRDLEAADSVINVAMGALHQGTNQVTLSRQGVGKLYYSAELSQVATNQKLAITSDKPGFAVIRRYYVMETRRLPDGTLRLVPSEKTVDTVKSGSVVRCEIEIISSDARDYVQIECPSPSNCHIAERSDDEYFEEWTSWWSNTSIRDDRIAFFSTSLGKGSSKLSYVMRAESPGVAHALPVLVRNMYDEAQRVDSGETTLTVTP